jgi:serine/threonine-protein kinase
VQTYEFGEADGRYYMTMEYLEGQTLRNAQRALRGGRLALSDELRILAETARALHYAHALTDFHDHPLNAVHRDVSPQNVFLTYDGAVKLLDFGIAKTDAAEHLTRVGVVKGKIDYIAPEQVRGDAVDRRADVFSLGVMLWEALTGRRFAGGAKVSEVTKMHARVSGSEAKLRDVSPGVPETLASLVDWAIALDPRDRLDSADKFADLIDAYLARLPARPTDKSLADALGTHFLEQRAKMRQLIERAAEVADRSDRAASLGASTLVDVPLTDSSVIDLSMTGSAQSSLAYVSPPASLPAASTFGAKTAKQLALIGAVVAAAAVVALFTGDAGVSLPVTRAGSVSEPASAPAAVAAVAPALATSAPSFAGPTATTAPTASRLAAPERTISLIIEVEPSSAVVTLDGAELPDLPFSGSVTASKVLHHLEARAEGYQSVRQLLTFAEDRKVKWVLEPLPKPIAALPKPAVAPHPKPAVAPHPKPAVALHPKPAPAPLPGRSALRGQVFAPTRDQPWVPGAELKTVRRRSGFDTKNPYAD